MQEQCTRMLGLQEQRFIRKQHPFGVEKLVDTAEAGTTAVSPPERAEFCQGSQADSVGSKAHAAELTEAGTVGRAITWANGSVHELWKEREIR